MRILKTMKPGTKGTQALAGEFGARLVCVRYRYDAATKKRYTTAEIIVAEGDWAPGGHAAEGNPSAWVRLRWDEKDLRGRVKEAGGRWDAERKLWEMTAGKARELHLEDSIVPDVPGVIEPTPRPPQGA